MRMSPILSSAALLALAASGAASAQTTFQEPRFEGLEMQKQMQTQNRIDQLEQQRQDAQARALNPQNHISAADAAITDLRFREQSERIQLEAREERDRATREAAIREQQLPNRRIAPSSILVVTDPYAYALPPAPKGQYYARLDGHFVLVDRASELVVKVLDDRPGDPAADRPAPVPPAPLPAVPAPRIGQPDPRDTPRP